MPQNRSTWPESRQKERKQNKKITIWTLVSIKHGTKIRRHMSKRIQEKMEKLRKDRKLFTGKCLLKKIKFK